MANTGTNKVKATHTFSQGTLDRIMAMSEFTMIPRSRIVERAIVEYLDRNAGSQGMHAAQGGKDRQEDREEE